MREMSVTVRCVGARVYDMLCPTDGRNVTYHFYLITINKLSFNTTLYSCSSMLLLPKYIAVEFKYSIKFYCHVVYRTLGTAGLWENAK